MINRIATNTSNSYYHSECLTCYITSFFITACAQNIFIQHECKQWTLTLLAHLPEPLTQSSSFTADALFQFVDTRFKKINMITVKYVTDFQWLCDLGDFFEQTHKLSSMNSLL